MTRRTLWGTRLGFAIAAAAVCAAPAMAGETGSLKAKFVYSGTAPAAKPIQVAGPAGFCGRRPLVDENLVVNPVNNGIRNVILHVYTGRSGSRLPPCPPANRTHELANRNCRFEPRIVIAQVGDTLEVTNADQVGHNTNIHFYANQPANLTVPPGGTIQVAMQQAEPAPMPTVCSIHPWMKAYVVVLDHPYAAVSDENGVLTIEGLPVGQELSFRLFHEAASGSIEVVKISGQATELNRNRINLMINPGMNDLGEIEIPAAAFQ